MVPLSALWLPILISAVLVFVVSSIIHMFLGYHKADVKALPNEAAVADALRKFDVPPGDYVIPHCESSAAMKSPEYQEKLAKGPVWFITAMPKGPMTMGSSLVQWFLFCVLVAVFAAYVSGRALPPGTHYLTVFRFAGATAFAGFGLALLQNSIWWKRNWGATLRGVFDALIYAGLTAGALGWRWPSA